MALLGICNVFQNGGQDDRKFKFTQKSFFFKVAEIIFFNATDVHMLLYGSIVYHQKIETRIVIFKWLDIMLLYISLP